MSNYGLNHVLDGGRRVIHASDDDLVQICILKRFAGCPRPVQANFQPQPDNHRMGY
jgi:hypothetical protein